MLDSKTIHQLFYKLNSALEQEGEKGEVIIVGGAVMCLVFNARNSTRDVDAVFKPAQTIRKHVQKIGEEMGIALDWLNDAAKGFLMPNFERQTILELSHLCVWAPEPKYMLAMKCISARWDTSDKDDVYFLIRFLNLKTAEDVFKIIEGYYPKKKVPPKTQFFIEELFENK